MQSIIEQFTRNNNVKTLNLQAQEEVIGGGIVAEVVWPDCFTNKEVKAYEKNINYMTGRLDSNHGKWATYLFIKQHLNCSCTVTRLADNTYQFEVNP